MENLKCLRCGTDMEFSGREQFQLGEESPYRGLLAVMTSESMQVDIYRCPDCGKLEFFEPGVRRRATQPQTNWTCAECGTYNAARVGTCQSCGVTRHWSDSQRRKE